MTRNPAAIYEPGTIPALSLWAPWSYLMSLDGEHALLRKANETRSWRTDYRGPVVIHSAMRWDSKIRLLCRQEPFRSTLLRTLLADVAAEACTSPQAFDRLVLERMPRGKLLCVVKFNDCCSTVSKRAAQHRYGDLETSFGDYDPGRYAIHTKLLGVLEQPITCVGRQGWFSVPADMLRIESAEDLLDLKGQTK